MRINRNDCGEGSLGRSSRCACKSALVSHQFRSFVREALVDIVGTPQGAIDSSIRLSKDVGDMIKAEIGHAWKRMFSLLEMDYAGSLT